MASESDRIDIGNWGVQQVNHYVERREEDFDAREDVEQRRGDSCHDQIELESHQEKVDTVDPSILRPSPPHNVRSCMKPTHSSLAKTKMQSKDDSNSTKSEGTKTPKVIVPPSEERTSKQSNIFNKLHYYECSKRISEGKQRRLEVEKAIKERAARRNGETVKVTGTIPLSRATYMYERGIQIKQKAEEMRTKELGERDAQRLRSISKGNISLNRATRIYYRHLGPERNSEGKQRRLEV